MKNFIITPTYNERNNIRILVEKIFALYPEIYVLIVDDNSPDGTRDVIKDLQNKYPNLLLIERAKKLGLATAYLESMKYVLERYPEANSIITMDADLSHSPEVIKTMLKEIEAHDLVIGSRYTEGGELKNWEVWRKLLSRWGNLYARIVTMSSIKDLTAGFNCYKTSLLRKYDLTAIKAVGFGFQMEVKIIAKKLGAKIKEVPITFTRRTDGESKISNHIIYEGLIVPWKFSPIIRLFNLKR